MDGKCSFKAHKAKSCFLLLICGVSFLRLERRRLLQSNYIFFYFSKRDFFLFLISRVVYVLLGSARAIYFRYVQLSAGMLCTCRVQKYCICFILLVFLGIFSNILVIIIFYYTSVFFYRSLYIF